MELLALVLVAILAFVAGYKYERFMRLWRELQEDIKKKVDKKPPKEQTSAFIDPTDPITQARMEHERLMKQLNPDE